MAVSTSLLTSYLSTTPSHSSAAESTSSRVLRTGTLRCGYNFWEPALTRNESTGQLEGFYADVIKLLSQETGLNIQLHHVVDWGQVQAELKSGKIDAMCAMWNTTTESRIFLFTQPFSYQSVEAIGRQNEVKFKNIQDINMPDVTIAIVDNATQDFIARDSFPQAKRISVPNMASNADLMMDVATGKADITFTNPGIFEGFNQHNPNQLKRLFPHTPLRLYGNSIALSQGEYDLANLLNVAIQHLINRGEIDKLIDIYNAKYPETFLKPTSTHQS